MPLVLLLALLVGACFVDRRSSDFACTSTSDCTGGRTCVDGYCVLSNAQACPVACTAAGGTCTNPTTCRFNCNTSSGCAGPILCPSAMACEVSCGASSACGSTISCALATSCRVECTAGSTCRGSITCGPGPCDINCAGSSACAGAITCSTSCACDVRCAGASACAAGAQCPASCDGPNGCMSSPSGCDTCP